MPERPIMPPMQKPVREFSLPDHTAGFFTELVSRESDRYQLAYPIKRGTLYSTVRGGDQRVSDSFAPLYFLKEARVANSDQLVTWSWGTDQLAMDTYNAEHSFSGDAISYPIFARVSHIRRDLWDSGAAQLATGIALTTLIAIKVTAAGTGYAATDTVNIAGGLGATAELVINSAGAIQSIIVTNGGSGYDSAALPAITFTTSTGSGATATAAVQPKTAVLVSQRKQELGHDSSFTSQSTDSPYSSTFVRVIRIWEVLPGPWLPFTRWDLLLGPIQGQRRAVLNTGQAPALTATAKTTYEARDGSAIVAWEIVETNSNGTGGANPAYPIRVDDLHDDPRGPVHIVSQATTDLSSLGTRTISGGVATETEYKAINQFLRDKVVTTWSVAARLFLGEYKTIGIPARVGAITHKAWGTNYASGLFATDFSYMSTSGVFTKRMASATSILCPTRKIVQYLDTAPTNVPWVVTWTAGAVVAGDIKLVSSVYSFATVGGGSPTWYELGPGNLGYVTQQLHYDGAFGIGVSLNNVLNNAMRIRVLLFTAGSPDTWVEMTYVTGFGIQFGSDTYYDDYNFAATVPNAGDYDVSTNPTGFGGRWWFIGATVEPWGLGYRRTTEEFLAPLVGWGI